MPELDTRHALFSRQHGRRIARVDAGRPGIGLLDAEQRRRGRQLLAEQIPFRADFEVARLLRLEIDVGRRERQAFSRRVEGRAEAGVDAALLARLVDHTGAAAGHGVGALERGRHTRDGGRGVVHGEPIPSQTAGQFQVRSDRGGVERYAAIEFAVPSVLAPLRTIGPGYGSFGFGW